ncbi:MAG TPA: AAA family ATPase, partial [Chitinophagaceae bacterium]|nr:AAA family ATPase [Chitinophagaceae bacterium]
MLARLSIQNYAIIDELEIEFSNKLNIITGETGAGKSIIVGALGLILGTRADSAALVNKAKKCVIEGVFNTGNKKAVTSFLKENELDADDEIVVRREIATNGKSRAFINDTPVNLSQLQQLSFMLVDLHLQFDTLEVGESDFQREVVDALAGNADLLEEYQLVFRKWQFVTKECDELKNQKQQFDKEADYNRFQFIELDEAAFKENELEEIDAELKLLSNSEGIKEALGKVYFELSESESPVPQQLKVLVNQLAAYSTYHPQLPELLQRLTSVQLELQDIAGDVDRISSTINFDPEKIEQLNERLSLGYKLQKKHGANSTADLLALHKELEEKLQAVLNIDTAIQQKEKEADTLFAKATEIAKRLSAKRTKQAKRLEKNVNELLSQVGMPNAKLKVELKEATLNIAGTDTIEFLFDANRSGQFQPVRKVASGGELSRLMLSI